LFDALDEAMPKMAGQTGMPMQLLRIFMGIQRTVEESGPSLRQQVCAQMPRPRSLRPLFDICSKVSPDAIIVMQRDGRPVGDTVYKQTSWRELRMLEKMCSKEICGRRGCDIPSTAQCANCKRTAYCKLDCQRKDWKEHKLVCSIDIDAVDSTSLFAEPRK